MTDNTLLPANGGSATGSTPTPVPDVALTAADLLETPDLIRVEVPEMMRGGRPGVVYLRYPKAREVVSYIMAPDTERGARLIDLTGRLLCSVDGSALFPTADQRKRFQETRADVFTRLSKRVGDLINAKDDGDTATGDDDNGRSPEGNASPATVLSDADGPSGGYKLTDSD